MRNSDTPEHYIDAIIPNNNTDDNFVDSQDKSLKINEKIYAICCVLALLFSIIFVPYYNCNNSDFSTNWFVNIFGIIIQIIIGTIFVSLIFNIVAFSLYYAYISLKDKFKIIMRRLFYLCKQDVFYTLTFCTTLYSAIFILLVILGFTYIEFSNGFSPFFIILKWFIFLSSLWIFYKKFKENNKSNILFLWGIIAVIFNTIFKIPFDETQWTVIIAVTSFVYLGYSIILIKKNNNSN